MAHDLAPMDAQTALVGASVEFVADATLLFRFGDCTILTDPSMQPPALPRLDGIVLSHLHGDYWDPTAEASLDLDLPIVTTPQAAQILRLRGFRRALPLKVWETTSLPEHQPTVMITAVPAQHGPKPIATLLGETHGHVIETTRADGKTLKVYVSGDTMLHAALHEIPRQFPGVDVAFIRLGSTKIASPACGVMVTLDDRGVVDLVRILQPEDGDMFSSGLQDFVEAMREQDLEGRLRIITRGERVAL